MNTDSLPQQPKAKRQRVPLSEQTFVNPDVQPEPKEVKPEKVAKAATGIENQNPQQQPTPRRESSVVVRAKKPKHGDRAANKGDGSLVLV